MKIERRVVDPSRGIVQITTEDSRWYGVNAELRGMTPHVGVATFLPSVTWITSYYPKGVGYMKWLASKGWDEAEAIRAGAGDRGSRVHRAISMLLAGDVIPHDAKIAGSDGLIAELTADEYEAVMSFADWYENGPCPKCKKAGCWKIVAYDYVVIGDGYAGTIDFKVNRRCDSSFGIVDVKTSKSVWESHRAQVQAYRKADEDTRGSRKSWCGILQVGYPLNARRWKYTASDPADWQLFVTSRRIWADQNKNAKPLQRDFPLTLQLKERA